MPKDGVSKSCDEVCEETFGVKETISRKKVAYKELCRFPSEENKTQHQRLSNQQESCCKSYGKESQTELNKLIQNSNSVFCFLKKSKKKWKDLEGENC